MSLIVWFTTNTTAFASVQEASRLVDAQLLITSQLHDLHEQTIDLVLWSPDILDKSVYERLWAICPRILMCVERGVVIPRWYPRYSPYNPLYLLIPPLNPEELCYFFKRGLDQGQ